MDESLFDDENQRIQKALNETKRRELAEKYGARFPENPSELPPDLESQWLNHVEEFERQFQSAQRISIRELLGFPTFKPLSEISREQLESELHGVIALLSQHGISIDCVADVSDEDLYRFITTELVDEEVDDIRIEGMTHCFIYEEFHPNDEYDAQSAAEHFLWDLFERQEEYVVSDFSADEVYNSAGRRIVREEIENIVRSFYARYATFTSRVFRCVGCSLDGEYATVTLQGGWSALKAGSMDAVSYNGQCAVKLKKSPYGGYDVIQANIPGIDG